MRNTILARASLNILCVTAAAGLAADALAQGQPISRRNFVQRALVYGAAVSLPLAELQAAGQGPVARQRGEQVERQKEASERAPKAKTSSKPSQRALELAPPKRLPELSKEIASRARAGGRDTYFLYVFGTDGPKARSTDSHTFASFVKVGADGGNQQWSTISWLPSGFDPKVGVKAPKTWFGGFKNTVFGNSVAPQQGQNYARLDQSLEWAMQPGHTLAIWGPFEISAELHELGVRRIREDLKPGKLKYLADDTDTRATNEAVNCMHALTDLEGPARPSWGDKTSWGRWGEDGTRHNLRKMLAKGPRWFLDATPANADHYQLRSF